MKDHRQFFHVIKSEFVYDLKDDDNVAETLVRFCEEHDDEYMYFVAACLWCSRPIIVSMPLDLESWLETIEDPTKSPVTIFGCTEHLAVDREKNREHWESN